MTSNNVWWLSVLVVAIYTMAPAMWFWYIVGMQLPASTVTPSVGSVVAVCSIILVTLGYSLGRNKPDPEARQCTKCRKYKYLSKE
jgi:uncharacterized membrane protein